MRLMPVSPLSVGVAGQVLPAVDWPGGLAPSLALQGSLQASLRMVLAERVLLSSPPASGLASRLASPTQFLRRALAQVSLERFLLQALVQVSLERFLLQALVQVSLHSSGRVSLVSVP